MAQESQDMLQEALARKQPAPVYLLYGEEEFLVTEAEREIVDASLSPAEQEFNLDMLYGNETNGQDIVAKAASFPMMAERRVVIVRNVDKLGQKDLEILDRYVEKPSPSSCLLMVGGKPDMRKKPFAAIKRMGFAVEFKPLYENQVPGWISTRVRQQGRQIDAEASKLLGAYVGTSLRELQNEIDKLFVYLGDKKEISIDDVSAVVGISKEYSVFELQRNIGARNIGKSVEIVERMLEAGQSIQLILAVLTSYFTSLWKLYDVRRRGKGEKEQQALTRIPPFAFREYVSAISNYSFAEIEHAFELLSVADEQSKSSGDPQQIMMNFLVQFMDREKGDFL